MSQLTWNDLQGYLTEATKGLAQEDIDDIQKTLIRMHSMMGSPFQGFGPEEQRDNAITRLSDRLGIGRDRADRLIVIWDNLLYQRDKPIQTDLRPNDFASQEEYKNAILAEIGLTPEASSVRTVAEEEAAAVDIAAAEEAAKRNDVNSRIQSFIDSMTGPSDPNDPVRRALIQAGTDAAQASAGSSGVRGGLANTAAASMVQANITPYETQRAQLRGQGVDLLSRYDLGLQQVQLGYDQLEAQQRAAEQQRLDMLAQNSYAGEMARRQGIGAAIGTGLGALGFIGGPALGAATMAAGGAIGGSLGGMTMNQAPTYQAQSLNRPRASTSRSRSSTTGSGRTGF